MRRYGYRKPRFKSPFRRTGYRTSAFSRKRFSRPPTARKLARAAFRKVKSLEKSKEVKHHNTSGLLTLTSASTTYSVGLNGIAQGNTSTTREGREIKLESLTINLQVHQADSTTGSIRVIICKDNANVQSTPAVTEWLNSVHVLSLHNNTSMDVGRYRFLYDKVFDLNANGRSTITQKLFIKGLGKTKYESGVATGTMEDIDRGQLWLVAFRLNGNATDHVAYRARLRYTDS